MDEKKDRGAFNHELELFAGRYPGQRMEPKHEAAFWVVLQFFAFEDVKTAFNQCANENPDRIPGASKVREYAAKIERQRREREDEENKRKAEEIEARKYKNPAPDDPGKAQAYIEAGSNPFERLARKWEAQSKRLRLEPSKPTPGNIAADRMREFWNIWGQHCEARNG